MSIFDSLFNSDKNMSGLNSELKAVYIYDLYLKSKDNILCVTNTLYEANQLYQAISCYSDNVLLFPMDDFLTSEALAISPDLKIKRLETLNNLNNKKIVITNLMGYLRFLPSKKTFESSYLNIKINDDIKIEELTSKLYNIGYNRTSIVTRTGEMAVRGFIIDIFPINSSNPVRIEFWGDTIESIKYFNIDTQRTIGEISNIKINPNSEFITEKEVDELEKKQKNLYKYSSVSNIEEYLDPKYTIFINENEIKTSYKHLKEEIYDYNVSKNIDQDNKYMYDLEEVKINKFINLDSFDNEKESAKAKQLEPFTSNLDETKARLNKYLKNKTVIICLNNRYSLDKVSNELKELNIVITNENEIYDNKINLIVKKIIGGFIYDKYVVISENILFNKKNKVTNYKTNFKFGTKINNISKLNKGDYVVHNSNGIGRYLGLKTLNKNGVLKDYLMIEYAGNDKLYIPVERIELISKYSAKDGVVPKLNRLGSPEWAKTKQRVRKKIEDIASKLLELYAKREASEGFAFDKDTEEQAIFESEFEYKETDDQLRVIEEIKRDMESPHPMDRLLCGDVGYGKTEVAFRAMFKAIMNNKQVAMLCPTTILSNQHYQSALERFSGFAVRVEVLNRFVTPKKVKEVIEDTKAGKVDILIGTHRILSNDISFKDLGLLIVDEEQRFGVKHKEKIKEYKNNVDILTLSATPIPRTLQMSMTGIRNLSLIETPPAERYPVQTYVMEENDAIIKDAIYKEMARDGQIFILYNSVENMLQKKNYIEKLVPEANILCVHGQMTKNEIEDIMNKFINKEADILLCTTIIETGIDISNVNTLIILEADKFGLSQLYQIRGRVGRSNKIAYCYLMYKPGKIISDIAKKRLNVIREFTELGSGFNIAVRDLSIRGAGDILGSEQAGFIDTIGIDLYLNMLEEETKRLQGNTITEEKEEISSQPLLDVKTSIDDNYVMEEDIKIEIHKMISKVDSLSSISKVKEEIEDRFGKIDDSLVIYMYEELFEKEALKLNIKQVKQTPNFIEIILPKELIDNIDVKDLFIEVSSLSRMFRFSKFLNTVKITLDIVKLDKHFIYYLIDLLQVINKLKQKK